MTDVAPIETDPNRPLLSIMPDALYADCRVEQPMVRKGWLEEGPVSLARRGADPFVPVDWDKAVDLVTDELTRVKDTFGNNAIFGGSYGWSSAGRFHHAQTQLKRFLGCIGGFTNSFGSYSNAAGQVILPHIFGASAGTGYGPYTSWDSIEASTELFVSFGGIGLKNTQVQRGHGRARDAKWLPH